MFLGLVGPLACAFQIRNSAPERDSYYTVIFLMFGPLGHYLSNVVVALRRDISHLKYKGAGSNKIVLRRKTSP